MLENNPETVKIVFKNMPLKFHKAAEPAARAALAANEQGKFWEFHDKLFAAKKLNMNVIQAIAIELELDIPRFKKDMNSSKIKGKLKKDLADAKKAGVTGTPTVFINGRTPKKRSLQSFQLLIDDELKKLGRKK